MKTNRLKSTITVFGALLLSSSFAYSQPPQGGKQAPPTTDEIFEEMDTNEDGFLMKAEVKGPIKKDFDKIDANGDGLISREELDNAPKPERKGPPQR